MMNSVEKITTLIPKYKQQLIFLREREKLFKQNDDYSTQYTDSSSMSSTNLNLSSSSIERISNHLSKDSFRNSTPDQSLDEQEFNELFPDKYIVSLLPDALIKDIEDGAMHKFGPHFSNRQVLIDTIVHDLINKYKLFYPTHAQYDTIGAAIIECLKLPPIKQNLGIWKDALQTKLKRIRYEHRDHTDVQQYQLKYAHVGSGRPIKKRIGEIAQRDHQKQMMLAFYDDITLSGIQAKAEELREISQTDVHNQMHLWRETIHIRRQYIRDNSTADIVKEFPGYSHPILVFEEVKIITKVDLSAAVRQQVPALLEKLVVTPVFVTDSSPIQLIKLLCRQFDESIHHIFCNTEPSSPYPTLICIGDLIHIYVDFIPVVSTTSIDDTLGLLIAMYSMFELCFNKNSRSIRLLYSVLHGDTRFLPNTLRTFVKEKHIHIYNEDNRQAIVSLSISFNNSTIFNNSQSSTQIETTTTCITTIEETNTSSNDSTNVSDFPTDFDLNTNSAINKNSSTEIIKETSSVLVDSQNQKMNVKKRSQRIRQVAQAKSKSFILTDDDNDDDIRENESPVNNPKFISNSRRNKRKRRA